MIANPFKHGMIMHIGPNGSYPLGRPEDWDKWIAEIKAMGFDGVKALVFADADTPDKQPIKALKKCLDNGLVVVCRLFRERPNPGVLTEAQIAVARLLVSMGVTLLEVNNEPNLHAEWQNNSFGDMAREVVARNWLVDAKRIVEIGGCPGIPAMSPGGNLDDGWFLDGMLAEVAKGVTPAILDNMWLACHPYSLNHDLDYPDDDVNRNGTPLTAEQYAAGGQWALPLAGVNAERVKGKHPTGSIMDAGESNGWRKFEMVHKLGERHLGRSLPVIATEGCAVMDLGFSGDPRYPLVMDEHTHAMLNSEMAWRMMNGKAPSWFWAMCPWVMANRLMENPAQAGFEAHSWYPYWKPDGLEVVHVFKMMPKRDRPTEPIIIPPPPVGDPVDAAVLAHVKRIMQTYPHGVKEALRRGYLPVMHETAVSVDGRMYYTQPARRQDGSTCLLVFAAGEYTSEQTRELEWTP